MFEEIYRSVLVLGNRKQNPNIIFLMNLLINHQPSPCNPHSNQHKTIFFVEIVYYLFIPRILVSTKGHSVVYSIKSSSLPLPPCLPRYYLQFQTNPKVADITVQKQRTVNSFDDLLHSLLQSTLRSLYSTKTY